MRISFRPIRGFLRELGLEVAYARYAPLLTDAKVYQALMPKRLVRVIFDIGANIGQTARLFAKNFPDAEIYCFEPFQANFAILQRNLGHLSKAKAFPIALGDTCGEREVRIDNIRGSQFNSLSKERQASFQNTAHSVERVTCLRGDEFCKTHHLADIDILKTDTEGFDLQVLGGFQQMLGAKRIYAICVEVGMAGDFSHTSLDKVYDYLTGLGYGLAGFYETIYSSKGTLEYTNALFVQRPA
jgi:FkbM family methyltransferase